jgi:hypothetical protein
MTKSRKIKWAEHVAHMVKLNMNTTFLVGKLEGKSVGRLTHRWEDNIKIGP